MVRTAVEKTAQVGGTNNAPTVLASPRPADSAVAVGGPIGPVIRAGNAVGGCSPVPGQGSCPSQPLTILSVCKPVPAPMMSRGKATTPITPNGMSAAKVAMAAGASRKILIRSLNVPNGSPACADVAAAGAAVARLCSALGTEENACWIVLCALPSAVPVACVTAAVWPVEAAGLVFCCGGVNAVSDVADADDAAYPYIAAVSWAHISAYCASLAAIFCVFRPNRFVATSVVSRLRLTATVCGGTVDVNAVWYAAAAVLACAAVSSACVAVAFSHAT